MQNELVIRESLSGIAPAIILGIIIISIMIYILMTMAGEANECRKMRHIQKLIEEGSARAKNGRKDDGVYQEKKQLKKNFYEDVEAWTKEAANVAQHDMDLLK